MRYAKFYRCLRTLYLGGRQIRRYEQELARTQWFKPEALRTWQLQRLQKLVRHAYQHIPYYRQRYQQEDIHPEDIKTLQDFAALPPVSKQEINANLEDFIDPRQRQNVQFDSTGGSTGEPLRFARENSFWWWNAALEWRGRGWHSVYQGDKMAWVWGAGQEMADTSLSRRLKILLMRHRYLNAFEMSQPQMAVFAQTLLRWQPAMIRAYPSALVLFAQYLQRNGLSVIHPKLIEVTAETLTDFQRETLEKVFAAPVVNCYSARELATIAYQCPAGNLHLAETRYVEVLADGRPVPSGQLGELVVTSLHQWAMPLIRYQIGDMGSLAEKPCSCGRGLAVLQVLAGRINDFLVADDGRFVHSTKLLRTFRLRPEVERFQVYQPDTGHIRIKLVCTRPVRQTWLNSLHTDLQKIFGPTMQILLDMVDHIPLTPAGKHRFIISEIKPDFSRIDRLE